MELYLHFLLWKHIPDLLSVIHIKDETHCTERTEINLTERTEQNRTMNCVLNDSTCVLVMKNKLKYKERLSADVSTSE